MPRLYEEIDYDGEAFLSVRILDDGEEELGVPYSKTSRYRKRYAEEYKAIKQHEKDCKRAEREKISAAAELRREKYDFGVRIVERIKSLLPSLELESDCFEDELGVHFVIYALIPNAPSAILTIPKDYTKETQFQNSLMDKLIIGVMDTLTGNV